MGDAQTRVNVQMDVEGDSTAENVEENRRLAGRGAGGRNEVGSEQVRAGDS